MKNLLEIAREEAKRQAEEKARQEAIEQKEHEEAQNLLQSLRNDVEDCLEQFHGVNGIVRGHNALFKDGCKIAQIEVKWEEWNNPNVDYREVESGYVIRWEMYTNDIYRNETPSYTGIGLEAFAKHMAPFVLPSTRK